jgi:outer membrane protein OmpA-like peptidoglycan-associated protein
MTAMKRLAMILAVLAMAGCSNEAGSEIGDGFGDSNRNNTLAMVSPRDFAISMTRKFASEVPNTVHFAFNSAVLDGAAQAALRQQAQWIRSYPEVRFRVFGHTDLVGSDAYNKGLGLRRAQAVVSYLSSQGVPRARLEAVVSFGKTQPLVYTPAPNERNRRTVTEVSGLMRTANAPLNGKYAEVIFAEYLKSAVPLPAVRLANQTTVGSGELKSSGN